MRTEGDIRLGVLFTVLLFAGCVQKMATGGKIKPYAPSPYFPDGKAAQHPPAGTVARGHADLDDAFYRGRVGGKPVERIPIRITPELLRRGRERFNIYCSPCHNEIGDGNGMIVQRGFAHPPSYHIDRLRAAAAGHFFDVITNGYGAMYGYADRVEPADRWAIVAYIRALQLSQNVRLRDLAPGERRRVREPPR